VKQNAIDLILAAYNVARCEGEHAVAYGFHVPIP
jgi:hypothetical protein